LEGGEEAMSAEPDHTAIHLYDVGAGDCNDGRGLVAIHGRIKDSAIKLLQEYLREPRNQGDVDRVEIKSRKWLEDHGYEVIYPLYWEQIWVKR
jgi:hypothetical protein